MKKFYSFSGFTAVLSLALSACATRTWPEEVPAESVLSASQVPGPLFEPEELALHQVHQHGEELVQPGGSRVTDAGKYVCPMHPEVVSDEPGSCTICGMTLQKKEESR